jgi:hypothetical protein
VTGRAVMVTLSVNHPALWPDRVECVENPQPFYGLHGDGPAVAQQICARCPMLRRCADWALEAPQYAAGGVFASVPVPAPSTNRSLKKARAAAFEQLRVVAATGIPASESDEQSPCAGFSDEIEEVA